MSLLNLKMGKKIMSNVHDLLNIYLNVNHEAIQAQTCPWFTRSNWAYNEENSVKCHPFSLAWLRAGDAAVESPWLVLVLAELTSPALITPNIGNDNRNAYIEFHVQGGSEHVLIPWPISSSHCFPRQILSPLPRRGRKRGRARIWMELVWLHSWTPC